MVKSEIYVNIAGKKIPLMLHEIYLPVIHGILTYSEARAMYQDELDVALAYVDLKIKSSQEEV